MNLRIITAIGALCFTASVTAATSPLPAQILCTPDQHSRVGIEKLDLPGSVAHLFEYGGKVAIKKVRDRTQYSYDQPQGQDFYKLKEKTAYSKDFVDIQHDIFLYTEPNFADSSGFLILSGQIQGGYFHVDWTTQRYYGFTREFGAINSYAGSCTVLKK
ncbi:hypothetical protein QEL91_002047 [Pseudomonas putida]|nr:hypothetical protein [Pseudomonas putida]